MRVILHEKQDVAFNSKATELLFGGAAGPGKSFLLRVSAIRWAMSIPGIQVYFFRRIFPDLRDNHLRGPTSFYVLLADMIAAGKCTFNQKDNEFTFWNGSRIALCHCQHEDDVQKYQGAEIHVLIMDELTHFTDYQYRFLRGRVRCIGLKIHPEYVGIIPRIECGSNPGSVGHSWVKEAFIKEPFQIWQTPPDEGGLLRQYIPAKLRDNPSLLLDDPNYEKRLDGLGSPNLVRAMKEGDWDLFVGQFFDNWRREIHVVPRNFVVPPHWNRFGAYDHGYNHPFCFGAYAVDEDGNVYKYQEAGSRGKPIDLVVQEILSVCPEAKSSGFTIYAGHDIWVKGRDTYTGTTSPELVERFRELGLSMIKAGIDRVNGAGRLREYLDWRKDKDGFSKVPKLYVRENCWRTIRQIPAMVYDELKPEDVQKVDATENDPWAGDDAYDETRYAIMSRPALSKQPGPGPTVKGSAKWFLDKHRADLGIGKRLRT